MKVWVHFLALKAEIGGWGESVSSHQVIIHNYHTFITLNQSSLILVCVIQLYNNPNLMKDYIIHDLANTHSKKNKKKLIYCTNRPCRYLHVRV